MHSYQPIRDSRSLRKYRVQQQRDVQLEGFEIGREEWKDRLFKEANHVTEFQVSETNKVGQTEPLLDA